MMQFNKRNVFLGIAVVLIIITAALLFANFKLGYGNVFSFLKSGSSDKLAQTAVDYINKNLLQPGQTATAESFSEESGVVKVKVKIGENSFDSYISKDGKLLFPQAFTIVEGQQTTQNTQPKEVTKTDKPLLEAYIVSSCPYGLQVQRALYNAVKSVPALAQYIKVKYIGAVSGNTITAMHGTEEAAENLRQICIRDEQQSKYWSYVGCYMEKASGTAANGMPYGDSKTCQTKAGVDSAKLNACVSDPTRGVAYAKEDFDAANEVNATASPTLLLNGATISEDSYGGRSADAMKKMVCEGSTTPGEFCSSALDTTPAATSFSVSYAGSATAATNAAACAPAGA